MKVNAFIVISSLNSIELHMIAYNELSRYESNPSSVLGCKCSQLRGGINDNQILQKRYA